MADQTKSSDSYILDTDQELDRLAKQHQIFKAAMGRLVLAPVDFSRGPLTTLDSCTANGFWIRDMVSELPPEAGHSFVGTDLMGGYLPSDPPLRTTFQVQDFNQPWPDAWRERFDLVHQRLALVSAGTGAAAVVARLAALVKPGGYVQLVESHFEAHVDDAPALRDFLAVIEAVFNMMGMELGFSRQARGWMEAAGLVDVDERVIDVFMGASNPDPALRQQGAESSATAAASLADVVKKLPQLPAGVSKEMLESMPGRLKAELFEKGANLPLRVIWGRKPE